MTKEEPVTFPCGNLELEGVLYIPDDEEKGSARVVVCHPHPVFGGSMENMVIQRICGSIADNGARCLRFNFRGVGASGGFHNGGKDEVKDVLSAVKYMRGGKKTTKVVLAGYSFGASMALLAACKDRAIKKVACVALPCGLFDVSPCTGPKGPKVLLITGNNDPVAPIADLSKFIEGSGSRVRLEPIPGTDHFFGGKMQAVGRLVADFLVGNGMAQKR